MLSFDHISSLAEELYFYSFRNPWVRSLTHAVLEDTRDTVNQVPGHDLIVGNTLEQLKVYLERGPRIVLTQDMYGFTMLH